MLGWRLWRLLVVVVLGWRLVVVVVLGWRLWSE